MDNSMFAGKARRVALLVLHLCGAVLLVVSGSAAGDGSDAACEPRGNTDPGRLNIAVEPDGYGVVPPCTSNLDLYIARNTPLRSIDVVIRVSMRDGGVLSIKAADIDLERTDYGMFAAQIGIDPEANQTCPSLAIGLEIKNCRGDGGGLIECPKIRVKAPQMFAGLSVSGENLNICHDD